VRAGLAPRDGAGVERLSDEPQVPEGDGVRAVARYPAFFRELDRVVFFGDLLGAAACRSGFRRSPPPSA
jgi:hypothetical protein